MELEPNTEEVATFYGKMLDHDYTTKEVFNNNFWKDWRKVGSQNQVSTLSLVVQVFHIFFVNKEVFNLCMIHFIRVFRLILTIGLFLLKMFSQFIYFIVNLNDKITQEVFF